MACKFEEPEFWLPADFLTDDEVLMAHGNLKEELNLGFPYDFAPPLLGSPVESSAESTESDEEDYSLTGLTRQLTRTNLNSYPSQQHEIEKGWVHSGSPQSTLTQIGSWSVRSSGSSNGSPNGPSQVSSPPTTPLGSQNDAWNLIYQAAGQVARMKMHGGFGPPIYQDLPGPPLRTLNPAHFEQARREQMARQQVKNVWFNEQPMCHSRSLRTGYEVGGFWCGNSGHQTVYSGLPFENQRQQQYQHRSGSVMRAAGCPAGSGNGGGGVVKKRECAGTGVFLPRRYSNHQNLTDSRKKPGCSTAWLPTRVQSMNKNVDGFSGIPQPQLRPQLHLDTGFLSVYEILMARRNALLAAQQRRNIMQQEVGSMNNLEVRLPQEWTY